METIPGCTSSFLRQFVTQHELRMENDDDGNESEELQVAGELHKLLCLHDNLSQLVSASESDLNENTENGLINKPSENKSKLRPAPLSFPRVITKDKAVSCDIIQPQYSRSGRQIKRKILDMPTSEESQIKLEPSATSTNKLPSRRGRRSKGQVNHYIKSGTYLPESQEGTDAAGSQTSMLDLIAAISNNEPPKASAQVSTKEEDMKETTESKHILVIEPTDINLPEEELTFHSIKVSNNGESNLGVSETVDFSTVSHELSTGGQEPAQRTMDDNEINSLSEKENSQDLDSIVANKNPGKFCKLSLMKGKI